MLFKFKSKACSDLIMLEGDGRRLLQIMLGDDPVKGIILVQDLPPAIAKLEAAVAQEAAVRKQVAVQARDEAMAQEDQNVATQFVSLAQRAAPMLKLLRQSLSQEADVVWGV